MESFIDNIFLEKIGIEIGGPSGGTFKRIYNICGKLDGINHENTIWQGKVKKGDYIKGGKQYIGDGLDLPKECLLKEYDFVLASHVLEHIANPLKALFHWKKIIKTGGYIYLILPKKELCFDHKRPITQMEVLIDKYKRNVGEDDLSSLDEILKLHDLSKDKQAGNLAQFKKRSLDNFSNRCLHHHVFDLNLLEIIAIFINMEVIFKHVNGLHQHIIYKK